MQKFPRFFAPIATGILVGYLVYFMIIKPDPAFPRSMDFTSWYAAGKMVLDGNAGELYDLNTQISYQTQIAFPYQTTGGALIYNRPPFFTFPFIALALLPLNWAYAIWIALLIAAGLAAVYLIASRIIKTNHCTASQWVRYFVICLAFYPTFQSVLLGQTPLLELLLLAGFYLSLRNNHAVLSGVLLGLASFKPQLVIFFVLMFFLRRSWKGLAAFAGTVGCLLLLSWPLIGFQGFTDYIAITNQVYGTNCNYGVFQEVHQSWRGLFSGLFLPLCSQATTLEKPFFDLGLNLTQVNTLGMIFSVITTTGAIIAWELSHRLHQERLAFDLLFSLMVIVSLLSSPYANPHDLVRLILPAAILLNIYRYKPEQARNGFYVMLLCFFVISPLITTRFALQWHPLVLMMLGCAAWLFYTIIRKDVQSHSERVK